MITVFGSINIDLIARVDRLPRPGETVGGSSFAAAAGGKGANQALAAARAGAPVRLLGAVGQDGFAEEALARLRDAGVDLTGVRSVAEPTGTAVILVDGRGENVIAVIPGANGALGAGDAAALRFAPGDLLLLQFEVPVAAAHAAAAAAKAAGIRVVLNLAPFHSDATALLPYVTDLIVNESEAELLAGSLGRREAMEQDRAAALARRLGVNVVLTLGGDGAVACFDGRMERVPALAVKATDTIGAGDTFCGYLAAALHQGTNTSAALRLAVAAASLSCTRPGAQPSIPWRGEVEAVLPR